LSTSEFVLIGFAVLFSSLVQTVTGFGFSLLAVPIMSMVVPTELAVVLSATLSTFTSGGQAWSERRHGDRPTTKRLVFASFVGMPFGLAILMVASSQQLKIGLAVVIILFLIVNLRGFRLENASTPVDVGAGFVAGVLSTSLSTNGPPLVMALHARHFAPEVFRGTISVVLVSLSVVSLGLFAATGYFTTDVAWSLLVAGPALVVGFFIGHRVRGKINPARFRGLVTLLLAATAVVTIVSVVVG
jgi:uncharacterized membrane protein YfcA